jgi:hypothetical protein
MELWIGGADSPLHPPGYATDYFFMVQPMVKAFEVQKLPEEFGHHLVHFLDTIGHALSSMFPLVVNVKVLS